MRPAPPAPLAAFAATLLLVLALARPAAAFDPLGPICGAAGMVSKIAGKACGLAQHPGHVLRAGKQLLHGHVGGAVSSLLGDSSSAASVVSKATFAVGLAAVGTWILGGAHASLELISGVVARSTAPRLESTWFSATYWRMAAISALLTLPFLCAAAVQALLRSDLSLLLRAGLGYLPLSLLLVGVAAPLTMLLLSATDAMSGLVSTAAGNSGAHFLTRMAQLATLLGLVSTSPFLGCFLGVLVVLASVVLWLEMLVREAAIYVVVLMLPLVFATLVWPARRVWALRSAELLFALVVSKFAVVAVLSLGGAAVDAAGVTRVATLSLGLALIGLAATAPWALMRLLPLAELASTLQGVHAGRLSAGGLTALSSGGAAHDWADDRALPRGQTGAPADADGGPAREMAKLGGRRDSFGEVPEAWPDTTQMAPDAGAAEGSTASDPITTSARAAGSVPPAPGGDALGADDRDPALAAEWAAEFSDGRDLVIGRPPPPMGHPEPPAADAGAPLPPDLEPPDPDPFLPPPDDEGL